MSRHFAKQNKNYQDLMKIDSYLERFKYLRLSGTLGEATFGSARFMNQLFYHSASWRKVRDYVISRDNGHDMGHPDYLIADSILVHHIVPLTEQMLVSDDPLCINPDNLISVSRTTHNAIHFGDESLLMITPIARTPRDTRLW